ncbi:uncharacterized protein DDB_G0280205-like [Oppia nitens]|uniref:uncharacterized protein DDB_G0280205-like n=1 Tax=Oppia nitens TaxID=1686743 RepID=UPI0023DC5230|nr:uncharacterized protein DDB_G0280205-like [Oppia nitens]XP_054166275.1 uncharacterized protein DDB_G0280205-like [Oppia nitens]
MVLMADETDRSGLFNEIRQFSQRKLKKVETKVTTGSGEVSTEKRVAKGIQTIKSEPTKGPGYVVDTKPDLQVGLIIPGLLIGSQDVAQDKTTLDNYEVTHILNLAYGVDNAFEDDYNYKKLEILDLPETDITVYFDDCFEYIDEGRRYGNCLVHCNAGVSRSCAICCAYLMAKEKMTFTDALNAIREARPFSRPNDGFVKQLQEYNETLRGNSGLKEANVDDSFTARQKAQIEEEKKALMTGGSTVKNKLKQFGAQLNAHFDQRAKCLNLIKLPLKKKAVTNDFQTPNDIKAPPPPPLPNNAKVPPPPPPPNSLKTPEKKWKYQENQPNKPIEPPKKLVINKNINKVVNNSPNSNPAVDETPISVKAFRKTFENNIQNEMPKIQTTAATPKPNALTNNPFNKFQTQTPEANKKKIFVKQRSKEAPDEQSVRRSTKDLVEAIEKANGSNNTREQLPYNQRRRVTTQLVENMDSNSNTQPVHRNNYMNNRSANSPQPLATQRTTIKLKSSASPSPAASSPMSSNRSSPQPPVSHSPSPVPFGPSDEPSKMVFGRVRPPRLSLTGRTLSQASQTLQDVSNKVPNNDNSCGRSASNSRSESPVSSVVGHNRNTKSKSASQEQSSLSTKTSTNAKPVSDNMAAKRTSVSPLKQTNDKINVNNNNNNNITTTNKHKNDCSSNSSSDENQLSGEELIDKTTNNDLYKSALTMQLKPSNKASNNNSNNINNESLTNNNDNNLTLTQQPFHDSNGYNSKRVPLGKTLGQQSFEKSRSGLNRSSSAQILKLIKTKSKADLGLDRLEEDDEIEAMLMELEKEGIDNIDWDELNVDIKEVKDIIEKEKVEESSDEDSSDEDSDEDSDDDEVHMIINKQTPHESDQSDEEFEVVDDEDD